MGGVGEVQYLAATFSDQFGAPVVDIGRSVEPDARVTVVVVIPTEEPAAVVMGVLKRPEHLWEVRPVLEGPEVALRVGVVVTHVGSGMGFGDTQVGEEVGDRLGDHR